ncbi:MAG: transporter substrate-binding domain-containing protein [Clostridia bacterium]|nr:transporter substrate-binding domain-containing protein [Clostridia bacterium]
MKKFLALVLAVLMLATVCVSFASCNKSSDWKQIEKEGKFVCGITIYAPMNYYDANGDLEEDESGTLIGFDTELAKLVAEKLGVEVDFQIIEWGNKYTELQSGAIDCIWNGFTSNSKDSDGIERSEKVDFTHAYLDNKQCVIVKTERLGEFTSAASLKDKKAGAESGSAGESYAKDAGAVIEAAKTSQMAVFTDLKSNAVDFIVVDRLLADAVVGKNDYADLSIVTAIDIEPEVYSIGCRKGSDFDEKINEALIELLNEGKVEELAAKYGVRVTDSLMAKKTAK